MKKIVSTILLFALLLTMSACEESTNSTPSTAAGTTAPTETLSDNPLIAAELQHGFVYNGSNTEVLGQYAYITISKSTLESISLDEYTEFCETVVDRSIYKWVSIICDDGTGIQFTGSQYVIATYGTINYQGVIIQAIGDIMQNETGFEYIDQNAVASETEVQGEPLSIGNLEFNLTDGMQVEEFEGGAYLVTLLEKKAYVEIFTTDVSELGDFTSSFATIQHNYHTEDRGEVSNETETTIQIAGFSAAGETYNNSNANGIILYHVDTSFTDTWYAYTFLFYCNGQDSNWEDYTILYQELLDTAEYIEPSDAG